MQFEESIQVFGLGGHNTLWDMHDSDSDSEPADTDVFLSNRKRSDDQKYACVRRLIKAGYYSKKFLRL